MAGVTEPNKTDGRTEEPEAVLHLGTAVIDLLKRISLKRLLLAVPIGLATTFGSLLARLAVHGSDYFAYIGLALAPTSILLWLFNPFRGEGYLVAVFVMQSALWYGILSLLPEDRARPSAWRRL